MVAKDSFAIVAAEYGEAKARRIRKEMKARGEWKVRWAGPALNEFWADVGRCSDRLRASADQQTMAPKGASEQVGKAETSGRKADKVSYDINPWKKWGAMPTSGGNTGGGGGADGVADGVAGGGMPTAYKRGPAGRRDRTWPGAEPMMSRRTPGRAVTDSDLLGAPEGSLALPWMWG